MRPPTALALLAGFALASVLAAPLASAEIAFEGPTRQGMSLRPGQPHDFVVPFTTSGGAVYAKLLPTIDNAVHDGTRANGTVDPPSGWRLAFSLREADGTRNDLGVRVDSEPTSTVALAPGERATLTATVHAPADAASPAHVYVVIALSATGDTSASSGARQDEARAVTLVLTRVDSPGNDAPLPGALAVLAVGAAALLLVRCRR